MPANNGFYFQWHFTESCNLRCAHCYQENYRPVKVSENELEEIAAMMEQALKKWGKIGGVALTGGEPFLEEATLFRLLERLEKAPSINWLAILTNGTLICPEHGEQLRKFQKLKGVQVSLDGSVPQVHDQIRGTGSFQAALQGIKCLQQAEVPVTIMYTIQRDNKEDAENIASLAHELKVSALAVDRVNEGSCSNVDSYGISRGEIEGIFRKIFQQHKIFVEQGATFRLTTSRPLWGLLGENAGGFCSAGVSALTILADGTVLPCRRMEIPLGNILRDGLHKIWYTSDLLWKLRDRKNLNEKCRNCELLNKCRGCRALAHSVYKDVFAEDPHCWR